VINKKDALVVVDVQNDFLSDGSLPVPNGEAVIPVLNYYIKAFKKRQAKIFATRDWHPLNHMSFREFGGMWPPHCIRDTKGAKFHSNLVLPKNSIIISKATEPDQEAYSGFEGTNLLKKLEKFKVIRLFIGGLATDYCVKNTVLDALKCGFRTFFLWDGSRGINANACDIEKSIELMEEYGAKKVILSNFYFWMV